jgi:tetratricopeptide (TPR) repeat protein
MVMPAPATPAPVPAPALDEVVVTSARIARPHIGRGDWNACTINDPSRSLSLCRRIVDAAAPGARGVAAAHLADGLTQAWRGDTAGAIAAFDRALAVTPDLAAAYLNRSLAYARNGDDDQALADADKAVHYAPNSAQARYNRGELLRRRGETARAEADEERAVDIDPSYEAVIPR